jgi:dTMP kinase
MQPRFIVVEGLEGAGKTSAVARIKTLLEQQGIACITCREPGGTPLAERIRTLVKAVNPQQEQLQPMTELLLMYASRLQLVANRIKPALAKGQWVIADRHDLSSQAY